MILFAVEEEAAEHRSLAHIYVAIDGEVGNVSILTESEVFELNLTVGAVYFESQVLALRICDSYVVDCYPVCIAVTLYGYLDTTIAACSCLVQGNLGDASQWRCYYAWFCSLVFAGVLGCLHETGYFREFSVGTCWINAHAIECKAEFFLAVEGFHLYHLVGSLTAVDFIPVGEISRVESLLLKSACLNKFDAVEVTVLCYFNLHVALSCFIYSSVVLDVFIFRSSFTDGESSTIVLVAIVHDGNDVSG